MAGEGILFWLEALNDSAQNVIDLDANSFYRVEIGRRKLLKVGLYTSPKVSGRLISLGRDPAHNDLILPGRVFSKNHCHFYFNKSSALVLRDTSSTRSTQVKCLGLNDDNFYRLQGDPKQRVLLPKHQIAVKVGPAQFRIIWHIPSEPSETKALQVAKTMFAQKQVAPELDLTLLDLQSLPSTAYELRSLYTPSVASQYQKLPNIVHEKLGLLGSGTFGTVHKTVDLNTGNMWAVKTSNYGVDDGGYRKSLKREVEILAELSHPNIVKFTHSQGWALGSPVEIFMSLHTGSLMQLIPPHKCDGGLMPEPFFCTVLVKQMLHAIAYLHSKGILHRDIKPENILYDHNGQNSSLVFYISDFGLSKKQNPSSSVDLAGSPLYMAPEINQGMPYTSKCDIWSFAVMMLLVLGYFCLEEPDLSPEEWKNRMAFLPRYCPEFIFDAVQAPAISLSGWRNQLRWYGRIRSWAQHKIIPSLLMPLLSETANDRPDALRCLSLFFPKQDNRQPAAALSTLPPNLEGQLHIPAPKKRTHKQEASNIVRRVRNSRKSAMLAEKPITTIHRPHRNLRSQKLAIEAVPPLNGIKR